MRRDELPNMTQPVHRRPSCSAQFLAMTLCVFPTDFFLPLPPLGIVPLDPAARRVHFTLAQRGRVPTVAESIEQIASRPSSRAPVLRSVGSKALSDSNAASAGDGYSLARLCPPGRLSPAVSVLVRYSRSDVSRSEGWDGHTWDLDSEWEGARYPPTTRAGQHEALTPRPRTIPPLACATRLRGYAVPARPKSRWAPTAAPCARVPAWTAQRLH